ncbi:MAG: hypothetical protein Q8920_11495 [Bacillota bacterium]|nr:hypothetical protein [Bacillota bacterium]
MQKAGGIISLIAGVFGVIAALITLVVGSTGSALGASGATVVRNLGWLGLLASFLVIVFGAISLNAKSKTIGILVIVFSVLGAIFGGTIVAIFMVLSLIGGILAAVGTNKLNSNER